MTSAPLRKCVVPSPVRPLLRFLPLLALGACVEGATGRWPTEAGEGSLRTLNASGPGLVRGGRAVMPNSARYRDSGVRPGRAMAGATTFELRALLGADGVTTIEATTGSFDAGPGPGIFEKVQLKVVGTGLAPVNAWPGASAWTYSMAGLAPGEQVQLQANVSGGGSPRTAVATATATVARRPDVTVYGVDGPATAYVNTPVTFFATVAEINGDVGARANCVLSVDGAAVDQASGIWIDAGGLVTCQFAHVFDAAGSYAVAVTATSVNPGDWDTANNGASRAITIVPAGTPIGFGSLQASDENYTYTYDADRTGDYPIQQRSGGTQSVSTVSFYGTLTQPAPGPLQRVEATLSTGETPIYSTSLAQLPSYQYTSGGAVVTCTDYSLNGEWAQSCSSAYPDGTGSTWFYYQHNSGTVTYYGETLYCGTFGCNTYTDNGTTVTGWGERYGLSAGSVLRVQLAFVDADAERHTVDREVTLQDFSGPVNYDTSGCAPYFDGLGDLCWRRTSAGTVWRGQVTW